MTSTEDEAIGDADTLPTSSDPYGVCPRCRRTSNFAHVGEALLNEGNRRENGNLFYNPTERMVALRCAGCRRGTVVVERQRSGVWQAQHWWPIASADSLLMDGIVPERMRTMYEEGVRCISVEAPHAAAVMARGVLAFLVSEKGSEEAQRKPNLYLKLEQMVNEGGIPANFREWLDVVRTTGNAGAHPDEYEEVDLTEAMDRMNLVFGLIDQIYIQPDKISKMKRARKLPKS